MRKYVQKEKALKEHCHANFVENCTPNNFGRKHMRKRNSEQKSEKEMRKHVSQKCNISSSSSDTNDTISSKSSSSSSANSSISEHSSESSNSSISKDSGSEVTIEDIDTREQFSLERELSILGESKSKNDVLASLDRLQDAALCMEIIKNSELEKKGESPCQIEEKCWSPSTAFRNKVQKD